jgi:hypothetical protein
MLLPAYIREIAQGAWQLLAVLLVTTAVTPACLFCYAFHICGFLSEVFAII